jgi:hypothetical protein
MKLPRKTENLIAEFRGLPKNYSRSVDRGSVPLDSLIEVINERYGIDKLTPEQMLMSCWKDILGDNAHRCSPVKLESDGTLLISVKNPIVKRELLFQKRRMVKSIQKLDGCSHILDLKFVAG